MPTRKSTGFAPLTDADEFESLVRDLCALEWGDPDTQRFGRSGQKQFGVDVYGKPVDLDGVYRAAQCKLRSRAHRLEEQEIEPEVCDAKHFPHPLDALIIVTDAPRDAHTQVLIDHICEREVRSGNFRVAVWFWEDITERLAAYPKLMVSYYRDYFASLTTLPVIERLVDVPLQVVFGMLQPSSEASHLQELLKLRGIRILQPSDLSTTLPLFQPAETPDGLAFQYNPALDGTESPAIQKLASAIQVYTHQVDRNCPIFVVLPARLESQMLKCVESLGGDAQRLTVLATELPCDEIADRVFDRVFDFGYMRRGGLTTIDIAARASPSKPRAALLDLDWYPRLSISRFPDPAEWQEVFTPALEIVARTVVGPGDGTRIQISSRLPLPAAFALGYYLNLRVARVGVWARRSAVSDFKRQLWMSDGKPASSTCRLDWTKQAENGGHTAIVELTTQVSVHKAVELFVRESGLTADAWLGISLSTQDSTDVDESLAVFYANKVGEHIRSLNAQGITDIYLFARMPSALAVLVGQRLQACGRIHLNWFDNPTYRFAFTLE